MSSLIIALIVLWLAAQVFAWTLMCMAGRPTPKPPKRRLR